MTIRILLRCTFKEPGCDFKVSEWIQRILNIGAAFAGADGAKGLRGLLTAQAENFFRYTHLLHMAHLCQNCATRTEGEVFSVPVSLQIACNAVLLPL